MAKSLPPNDGLVSTSDRTTLVSAPELKVAKNFDHVPTAGPAVKIATRGAPLALNSKVAGEEIKRFVR